MPNIVGGRRHGHGGAGTNGNYDGSGFFKRRDQLREEDSRRQLENRPNKPEANQNKPNKPGANLPFVASKRRRKRKETASASAVTPATIRKKDSLLLPCTDEKENVPPASQKAPPRTPPPTTRIRQCLQRVDQGLPKPEAVLEGRCATMMETEGISPGMLPTLTSPECASMRIGFGHKRRLRQTPSFNFPIPKQTSMQPSSSPVRKPSEPSLAAISVPRASLAIAIKRPATKRPAPAATQTIPSASKKIATTSEGTPSQALMHAFTQLPHSTSFLSGLADSCQDTTVPQFGLVSARKRGHSRLEGQPAAKKHANSSHCQMASTAGSSGQEQTLVSEKIQLGGPPVVPPEFHLSTPPASKHEEASEEEESPPIPASDDEEASPPLPASDDKEASEEEQTRKEEATLRRMKWLTSVWKKSQEEAIAYGVDPPPKPVELRQWEDQRDDRFLKSQVPATQGPPP